MSKQLVPIAKQSKKAQKEYYQKKRGSWNGLNPVTRVIPNGKRYVRAKEKSEVEKTKALG